VRWNKVSQFNNRPLIEGSRHCPCAGAASHRPNKGTRSSEIVKQHAQPRPHRSRSKFGWVDRSHFSNSLDFDQPPGIFDLQRTGFGLAADDKSSEFLGPKWRFLSIALRFQSRNLRSSETGRCWHRAAGRFVQLNTVRPRNFLIVKGCRRRAHKNLGAVAGPGSPRPRSAEFSSRSDIIVAITGTSYSSTTPSVIYIQLGFDMTVSNVAIIRNNPGKSRVRRPARRDRCCPWAIIPSGIFIVAARSSLRDRSFLRSNRNLTALDLESKQRNRVGIHTGVRVFLTSDRFDQIAGRSRPSGHRTDIRSRGDGIRTPLSRELFSDWG